MAVEQPKDFAYGYDVKPLAPAPNEHDSARSAVNLTAGLALQALAREGASPDEVRLAAEVFLSAENVASLVQDGLTAQQAAQVLKALEPYDANAAAAQKSVNALDEAHTRAEATARRLDVTEAEWDRRVEETRATLRANLTDPLEVWNAYLAVPDDDHVSLAAFESLGSVFNKHTQQLAPALDAERVAERQLARYRRKYPEAFAERNKTARLASIYRQASSVVKTEIVKRVGSQAPIEVL